MILPFIYKNAAVREQDINYRVGLLYLNQDTVKKKTNFPVSCFEQPSWPFE